MLYYYSWRNLVVRFVLGVFRMDVIRVFQI